MVHGMALTTIKTLWRAVASILIRTVATHMRPHQTHSPTRCEMQRGFWLQGTMIRTSSIGSSYFSTSTSSSGQNLSFFMCRSSPARLKKSRAYLLVWTRFGKFEGNHSILSSTFWLATLRFLK